MKLTCTQADFNSALSIVGRAVSPNNTLPVLNNILLKAEGKRVFLRATNLEIAINASFEADVKNEGALTVPAKSLSAYIALLGQEFLELTVTEGTTLEIKSSGSTSSMKGIVADEFPLLPVLKDAQSFTLPAKELQEAIEQVVFAASTNISRPVLTGIFFKVSGDQFVLAATDSYRLGEKTVSWKNATGVETSFILPSKTAQELAKVISSLNAEEVEVKVTKGQIQFKIGGVELLSRLIEGNFPDYQKILPNEEKSTAVVDREAFTLGLKKLSVIVRDSNNNVKVSLGDGKLTIFSEETQLGKGTVEIPVETKGEKLEAALNVQYLLDVLGHLRDEQVHFSLNDGLSPVKVVPVKTSGTLHIIMPLKV